VTFREWRTIYDYDPVTLWIAYGATLLLATLAIVTGIIAMVWNGAAYDDSFSSILRMSRLDAVDLHGDDGSRPLPNALARSAVVIASATHATVATIAERSAFDDSAERDDGHDGNSESVLLVSAKPQRHL
jgi:multisubunit Na+/H+ antiporter MnhC subunit